MMQVITIQCPECGSADVWVSTQVTARAKVNLNTWDVVGIVAGECDNKACALADADRTCLECDHTWAV